MPIEVFDVRYRKERKYSGTFRMTDQVLNTVVEAKMKFPPFPPCKAQS